MQWKNIKKMNDTILITNYIAAWGWQILAMMSLLFSFIFMTLEGLMADAFYVSLFFVFVGCECMSLKRKKEVQDAI